MRGNYTKQRVTLYKFERTYKAGDTIVIETDSKEYLNQAKKEYAINRKHKKIKK